MKLLIVALGAEVALFAAIAPNFLTVGNLAEITRSSVELGLLALALTPIIVSGGIDLSVGSMMGLVAVVFGAAAVRSPLRQRWRCSSALAAAG
jgi:ribose/xylose/arabinose/galactoside ABC-type transport system permease subunit